MKIANAKLSVARFGTEDVIATSGFYIPAASWNEGYGTPVGEPSDYVHYYSNMGYYDNEAAGWNAYPMGDSASYASQASINEYIADAQTHDPSTQHALLDGLYDAYEYNGGYYTKGASYYDLYGNQ